MSLDPYFLLCLVVMTTGPSCMLVQILKLRIYAITQQKHDVETTYSKTCVKRPLKIDKTKILITIGSLMKVESIAECSTRTWSILQYF